MGLTTLEIATTVISVILIVVALYMTSWIQSDYFGLLFALLLVIGGSFMVDMGLHPSNYLPWEDDDSSTNNMFLVIGSVILIICGILFIRIVFDLFVMPNSSRIRTRRTRRPLPPSDNNWIII